MKQKLSLEDARRTGNLKRFVAERQQEQGAADKGRFDALLSAMAKTPGAKPAAKRQRRGVKG